MHDELEVGLLVEPSDLSLDLLGKLSDPNSYLV
jgi:hypothetical protein